jgi:hypothetical protein
MTVGQHLPHKRQRRRPRIFHRPDHRPEIEGNVSFKFAGQMLHPPVLHQAADLEMLDATIACGEQSALKQCGANTMALPGLLDAERGLGLLQIEGSDNAQIGGAAQHPVHEEAMQDDIGAARRSSIASDCVLGDCATEAIACIRGLRNFVRFVLSPRAHPPRAGVNASGFADS